MFNLFYVERKTRLELATPTLARLCSTNWAISADLKCPRQESNLHVSQHSHLKRARLPFRHVGKWKRISERKTRLELATPTLARLCSTNWAISAVSETLQPYLTSWRGGDSNSHGLSPLPPQSSASTIPPPLHSVWCPRQESNLHVSQHSHLKRARLPFRHVGIVFCSQRASCLLQESGKRDSNSRPQPWQGCALPTELFPHCLSDCECKGTTFSWTDKTFQEKNILKLLFLFTCLLTPYLYSVRVG